ncbi:histidine phosphatase family protein [Alkanindiges sp. WGS2144]|uniref:histidine phosphatase family protein n=1 Tax=Alkanindiges sp. WGS2144 TaxID=3366808 RepID=UPI003752FFCB
MLQAVDLLPQHNQPLVLLTRHSIRELADSNGFATYQLPLTHIGRDLAFEWGKWLAQYTNLQITACLSSPIPRCVDTASQMLKGAETTKKIDASLLNIEQNNLLVEPGSFVLDVAQAGPHFKQYGALKFINAFLKHQLPGMKMPWQGALDILRLLFEHLPRQNNQLLLAVSHDTILAALFSVMAGQHHISRQDWPQMMEGAFLWFEGDTFEQSVVNWIWRGQHYRFEIS